MDCKNCEFNNNGWCKKYNMQKPKAMLECQEESDDAIGCKNETYIVNGKAQMLSNIIRQIDACEGCVTDDFKNVIKSLYQTLEMEIKIHGISMDYEIDSDILNDLRYRMSQW